MSRLHARLRFVLLAALKAFSFAFSVWTYQYYTGHKETLYCYTESLQVVRGVLILVCGALLAVKNAVLSLVALRAVLQKLSGDVGDGVGKIDFAVISRWFLKSESLIGTGVPPLFYKVDHLA